MEEQDLKSLISKIYVNGMLQENTARKLEDMGDVRAIFPLLSAYRECVARRNPEETIARECAISAVWILCSLPEFKETKEPELSAIIEGLIAAYNESSDANRPSIFLALQSVIKAIPTSDAVRLRIEAVFSDWQEREKMILEKNKRELLPGTNDW